MASKKTRPDHHSVEHVAMMKFISLDTISNMSGIQLIKYFVCNFSCFLIMYFIHHYLILIHFNPDKFQEIIPWDELRKKESNKGRSEIYRLGGLE